MAFPLKGKKQAELIVLDNKLDKKLGPADKDMPTKTKGSGKKSFPPAAKSGKANPFGKGKK